MLSPWIYLMMNGLFFTLRLSGGSGSFPRPLKAAEERLRQAEAACQSARAEAREADQALEDRTAQIEPAMVLVCSLMVGAILLSVMLPLMNIMSAIG